LWGTGKAKREIIHVDDLANAIVFFMNKKTKHTLINIGTSKDYSIKQISNKIIKILNLDLRIKFNNNSKFDGVKRKLLNSSIAHAYGWKPKIKFEEAILNTYNDLEMMGKESNLFALGCFTKTSTNHIAYMVGAIDAVAEYLKKYENISYNIFK